MVPPPPASQFKLSVAVSGGGVVTDAAALTCTADCAADYGADATVTLRAVSSGSAAFVGWTGDCAGTTTPSCTLRVTRDLHVGATFAAGARTLTVVVQGQGTVTSTPPGIACPGACSASFPAGTNVSLSAAGQGGVVLTGWSGPCTGASCQVRMTADAAVTATFAPPPPPAANVQLAVTVQGSGSITSAPAGISCPGVCSAPFPAGTAVTLSAAPASGFQFSSWSGACSGASGCQLTLASDSSVAGIFSALPPPPPPPPPASSFVVTIAVQGSGTVTSTPAGISCPGTCSSSFAAGTSLTLSATPATGSTFSGWSGACAASGTSACAIAPTADSSSSAAFASSTPASTRLLTVSAQGSGTVTSTPSGISCSSGGGTCSASFPTGTAVALKAAPASGSVLAGWSGACTDAYDCQVALASDTAVGVAFAAATPFSAADWTFYGAKDGLPAHVLGVSADAGGNLWVAGGEDGLFVLRSGDTAFQRFTMADGLRPYGYMADGSAPPGTPYLNVLSVAGGPAGTAYVGYAGKTVAGQPDCESNWDSATPDPSIYKSGDADKVTLVGNGIAVVHYDIFSGPGVVGGEKRGREKLCNVLRIVYDPAQDAVWFGANHGFALGRASFQGAPTCDGQLSCAGVWEHVHPAINGYPTATSTTLVYLTADYNGVAVDPVTHDTWFGGQIRTTKFHYATQKPSYWAESYFRAESLTEDAPYISNRIDVWPDKVQEPAYPRPADRVDDNVSGIAAMQDGTAWVASSSLGLARLDANGVVLGYVKDSLLYPHVGAIAADPIDLAPGERQGIWAGQRWVGGLVRIAGGTVQQISYGALGNTLANSPVRDIQMQGTGSSRRVLIAFENGVVGVYSGR